MTKVYEQWPGSNKFCCWGLFIFGPDIRSLIISVFLISVPSILFCIFIAAQFVGKLAYGGVILPVTIIFTVWDLFILFFTASRDPGIVPRNKVPPEPEPGAPPPQPGQRRLPRTKDVTINGKTVKVKYCDTCQLYRPPRCSHCSICNNCVERFDHHCPWVGQCIGKRNYRYFFIFVSSTTLLCIFVFSMTVVYIKVLMDNAYTPNGQGRTVWQALAAAPMSVVLMAYTFVMVWFVGGLTAFHLYLMSTNQTTYENFRYRYDRKANPYNRGACNNVCEALCSPVPPSRNRFRAEIIEPDMEQQPMPSVAAEASTRVEPELSAAVPPVKLKRPGSRGSSGGRSPANTDYELVEVTKLREDEGGVIAERIVETGISPSASKSPKKSGGSSEVKKKKKKKSAKKDSDGEEKPKRKSSKKKTQGQVQGDGWDVPSPDPQEEVDLEEGRYRERHSKHDEYGRVHDGPGLI